MNLNILQHDFKEIDKKQSYVNTRIKLYEGLKQKSLLTLPPDPASVKRVNLQIKTWLQSLNQNMTFPSFKQNGWKWCHGKLIMVPVWFTGSQLPPTVVKRSHKVKVTRKDVYLRDNNLADDEENIAEPQRKKNQKIITVSPSSKSDF